MDECQANIKQTRMSLDHLRKSIFEVPSVLSDIFFETEV